MREVWQRMLLLPQIKHWQKKQMKKQALTKTP